MDERAAARHEDLLSELKSSPEHAERARFSAAGGKDGSDVRLLKLLPFLAKTQWPFAAAFGDALVGAMQGKEPRTASKEQNTPVEAKAKPEALVEAAHAGDAGSDRSRPGGRRRCGFWCKKQILVGTHKAAGGRGRRR